MNYLEQLRRAIAALKPLEDRDPLYSDCLFHLESQLRTARKLKPPDEEKLPPGDFLHYPSDGWENDKIK